MAENTNRLVVDASFVLSFLLPDEVIPEEIDSYFEQFKNGEIEIISSALIHFEVINGLKMAFARKRISLEYCNDRITEFLNYEIEIKLVDFDQVFQLALKENLTVYDASYLYLAKTESIPLLTLDGKLASAL